MLFCRSLQVVWTKILFHLWRWDIPQQLCRQPHSPIEISVQSQRASSWLIFQVIPGLKNLSLFLHPPSLHSHYSSLQFRLSLNILFMRLFITCMAQRLTLHNSIFSPHAIFWFQTIITLNIISSIYFVTDMWNAHRGLQPRLWYRIIFRAASAVKRSTAQYNTGRQIIW